jgi:hypothetical protein
MSDAIAEVLMRFELGDFDPKVRERLDAIFTENGPDAMSRLAAAAEYLGITGSTKVTLARVDALIRSRTREELKMQTAKTKESEG